jgi:hypothetical protein
METIWQCRYSSTGPDLGIGWRWVVSITPRPLYPRGKSPRYPLGRRLDGPQSRSGRHGEVNSWPYRVSISSPSVVQPVASHCTNCCSLALFEVLRGGCDRLCGLVVRDHGYRSKGLGSIPGSTRFSEESGTGYTQLQELLGRKSSGSGLENQD